METQAATSVKAEVQSMGDDGAPRVFVSHGSEDKERFVIPFATELRAQGVDAWVDRWEIRSGDSLVQKIFDEGIEKAQAFVVVLSLTSIQKPWVRDELDAAVIARIESGRRRRLIPVVLDDGVEVPAALRHLLRESVPRDGLGRVTRNIVNALFDRDTRPPLGPEPAYARIETLRWTGVPADDVVLGLIIKMWRGLTPLHTAFSNDVRDAAAELGIDADQFHESMHGLVNRRLIDAQMMAGGLRWMLRPMPDHVWLRAEAQAGVDIEAARHRVLSLIVNDGASRIDPVDTGLKAFTVGAVLREFDRQGLMTVHMINDGTFVVMGVSPLARRALRN